MIGVVAAASALNGIQGLLGGGGLSDKDKARVNAANDALTKALNGDASALQYMIQQSNNSATQVGKNAFRAALTQYYNAKSGQVTTAPATSTVQYQSTQTPLQQVVNDTTSRVNQDIANGVQQIGAGATTQLSNSISGNNSALTLPTNMKTIVLVGIAALGAFLIFSKHK